MPSKITIDGLTFSSEGDEALKAYRDIDWTNLYTLLGMFMVEFEKACAALRFSYGSILQQEGLRTSSLGSNLLNIPQIGPGHLAVAYCAAIQQVSQDDGLKQRAKALVKSCTRLAEIRNEVLHGEWMVGPEVVIVSSALELPKRHGVKRKAGKEGEIVTELPTLDELGEHVREAVRLRVEIQSISVANLEHHVRDNPQLYSTGPANPWHENVGDAD